MRRLVERMLVGAGAAIHTVALTKQASADGDSGVLVGDVPMTQSQGPDPAPEATLSHAANIPVVVPQQVRTFSVGR